MKELIISTLLGFFIISPAFADWIDDFSVNYEDKGIEYAVPKALKEGKAPQNIIKEGLKLTGLNPQNLLKALYCSGADGDDIKEGATENDISELIIVAAFRKAVTECGDAVADSQAYTPLGPSFSGIPSPTSGSGTSFASPSTF